MPTCPKCGLIGINNITICECGYAFLDKHGQPLNRYLSAKRLNTRIIDELIGICKGVVSDNVLKAEEVHFLAQWLENNKDITNTWPVNILVERIREIFIDNIVDERELEELFEILKNITGGPSTTHKSTELPLDKPPPEIIFENKFFCLTGQFAYGARHTCVTEILIRKGRVHPNPTRKTDYLVIGVTGSTDWIHSPYGRKIEHVIEQKSKGFPIAIVSEEHWARHLGVARQ